MAVTISVKGLDELLKGMGQFQGELPFVLAKSLTDLAYVAKDNTVDEMRRVFNMPTPFTLNALKVERATKSNLNAKVLLKDPPKIDDPEHYLNPAVVGGRRSFKGFEMRLYRVGVLPRGYYAVPAKGADFDMYGNMKRGQIVQILSFFDSFRDAGYTANMGKPGRDKLKKATKKRYGIEYFSISPISNKSALNPGIYKRIYSNFGNAIVPILLYVKLTNYKKVLDIESIADKTYRFRFNAIFNNVFRKTINTSFKQ